MKEPNDSVEYTKFTFRWADYYTRNSALQIWKYNGKTNNFMNEEIKIKDNGIKRGIRNVRIHKGYKILWYM